MNSTKKYTREETLKMINEILKEVVPGKVTDDVTPEISITEDLALDSVELMDVLLKIREQLTSEEKNIDMDKLLNFLFRAGAGESIEVQSLCDLVNELA